MNVWCLADLRDFDSLALEVGQALLAAPEVRVGSWQSQSTRDHPMAVSFELSHAHIEMPLPHRTMKHEGYAAILGANLPWAEDHFQERVSGWPLNPPPSEAWWPYAQAGNAEHKADDKFSHTYPERFWPQFAGLAQGPYSYEGLTGNTGIRYRYGDLNDVVNLLNKDPQTRQAYLPVWFPEDTGSVSGQRVPCTLGYHFLCRDGKLDIEYHIRSCDYMRHWRDDVYMAGRLAQWVSSRMDVETGKLVMNIGSFHIFQGDRIPLNRAVRDLYCRVQMNRYSRIMNAL